MVALLEKRAGEELFRKHVATVVQGAVAALAAELGASGAGAGTVTGAAAADGTPGKAAGAASAGAAPGPTPQKDGGGGGEGGGPAPGSRFLDTMAFLNDLGRCACCIWLACLRAAELLQPWRQLPALLWARSHLIQHRTRAALTNPAPLPPLLPCRAGSFRREMAPFAARWVYGRGVPHVTAAFIYHA